MEEEKLNQPAQPQPAPEQPPTPVKEEPKFSFRKWPFIVIGVLLLVILLMSGFFIATKKTAVEPTPSPAVSEQISPTQLTSVPTSVEMKSFTSAKFTDLSFKGYTLKYPEDWTLSEDRDASVPISTVTLTKKGYTLKIFQAATGGAQCIYEGDMPEGPASDYRNSKFTDLVSFANLRQTESISNGKMTYVYCQQNETDKSYGQPTSVGHMTVTTGVATPDTQVLNEIESIVESINAL